MRIKINWNKVVISLFLIVLIIILIFQYNKINDLIQSSSELEELEYKLCNLLNKSIYLNNKFIEDENKRTSLNLSYIDPIKHCGPVG